MLDKLNRSSTCLFIQATLPVCRYVVVRESVGLPVLVAAGSFAIDDFSSLANDVRQEISDESSVSRAVLLLPRGEVEVNSLRLPPATDEELPELVGNMLAQQSDENATSIHDFVVCKQLDDNACDVVTFTVSEDTIKRWTQQFKDCQFKLEAITFGGLGAVNLLNQVAQHPAKTSVVVTTTDQDTDLAIVEDEKPILFRTIPRGTGGEQSVIEQLAGDIQRTLTLQSHPDDEDPRIYLIGTNDPDQTEAAKSLNEKLGLPVNLVNPFDQLAGNIKNAAKVKRPSRFANLIGTACAWNRQQLDANLLAPKQPPKPPTWWSRYGFWGSVAASLLVLGGYMMWEKAEDQRLQVEEQRTQLMRLVKQVKKSQNKQAIASALESWQANEINWLDELHFLSERLPPADQATIRSLTMTVSAGQRGRIAMPVEIASADLRSVIEKRISDQRHGISSKRLFDASNANRTSWQFQTTISVAPDRSPKSQQESTK